MPKRNVATNYTFEQQRQEINLIAADLWDGVLGGASTDFSTVVGWGNHGDQGYLKKDGSVATTAAFTFGNKIIGPSTFTIEPTNVNGTVVIAGNLQVDGTQTAVNSTTMDVTDLNITVAKGAANSAAADTAGITVDGANATLQYEDGSPGTWESSLGFRLDGRNASAGLALNIAGSADYLIRESTTNDIVQFGGTGGANFFAHNISSGNIGIAEANPSYKLDVNGTLRVTGNSTFGDITSDNITIQRGSADNADLNIGATGTGEARIYLDASNGDFSGGDYAYFKQTDAGLLKIGNMNSGGVQIIVGEGAGGAGTALTVTNGGNVGIGTGTDPVDRKLHVKSSGLIAKLESTTANSLIMFATPTNETAGTVPNIGANDNDLEFTTGNLSRLKIHSDGQVTLGNDHSGAGTWDGDLVVANSTGGRISVGDTGSGERFDIAANGDINLYSYLNGDHINFHTTDGSGTFNRFRIQSNGNVVIPSGYLQIDPSDHDKLKLKVPSGSSDDWAYMTFWGEDGNRNAYVGTNATGDVKVSRDGGCNLELGANAIFNANVSDSKGDLRSIPQNATSAAYTLAASDVGKHVYHTSTGAITVPATSGVFDVGDAVTIVNGHASDSFEILSAGGVTIWLAGAASPTSGTRTLAVKGICTLICVSSNGYYISGAGLT